MFKIILIMAAGIGIGRLLRNKKLPYLGRITNVLIWVLLFLLGIEVGSDERIVIGIATLGFEAIAISIAGVAGCTILSLLLWKWVTHSEKKDLSGKSCRNIEKGGNRI